LSADDHVLLIVQVSDYESERAAKGMITVDIIGLFLLGVEHECLDEETVRDHIIVDEFQVGHTLLQGLNQEV